MANQQMPPSYMAYDRTIVVFSPDGRLLQVEYAREMVKNGTTSIGVRAKDAVVLGTIKISVPLAETESYRKIYKIDDHIGAVSSGSLADSRNLVEKARVRAQMNRLTYGEPVSISTLTTYICNHKHLVTQYAGVRPYGVGMLVGGMDDSTPRLFETEPSGTMIEWKAQAIGRGASKARNVLKKGYKEGLPVDGVVRLLVKALKAGEKEVGKGNTEISVIDKGGFKKLSQEEVAKYL
jgi:proteasome alpha subunit